LREGDIIRAIDGVNVTEFGLNRVQRFLDRPGLAAALTVTRGATSERIVLGAPGR